MSVLLLQSVECVGENFDPTGQMVLDPPLAGKIIGWGETHMREGDCQY